MVGCAGLDAAGWAWRREGQEEEQEEEGDKEKVEEIVVEGVEQKKRREEEEKEDEEAAGRACIKNARSARIRRENARLTTVDESGEHP